MKRAEQEELEGQKNLSWRHDNQDVDNCHNDTQHYIIQPSATHPSNTWLREIKHNYNWHYEILQSNTQDVNNCHKDTQHYIMQRKCNSIQQNFA